MHDDTKSMDRNLMILNNENIYDRYWECTDYNNK